MSAPGGRVVLKARTVTDLLDVTVGLYRHNFGTLLGVVAVVYAPLLALQTGATTLYAWGMLGATSDQAPGIGEAVPMLVGLAGMGVYWLANLIFAPLATGAVTLSVSDLYLGRAVQWREVYRRARRWWGSLILAQFLVQLMVGAVAMVLGLVLFVPAAALTAVSPAVGIALMILAGLLVLVGVVTGFLLLMATIPSIVVENRGVTEAIGRSFQLVRRGWKKALAAFTLLLLLVSIPMLIARGIGMLAQSQAEMEQLAATSALASALGALASLLVLPITMAGMVVIYYDLRVRQEGLDLEMMAANLGLQAAAEAGLPAPVSLVRPAVAPPPPPPPPPPGEGGPAP